MSEYVIATGSKPVFYIGTLDDPERLNINYEEFYFPHYASFPNLCEGIKERIRSHFKEQTMLFKVEPTNDALREMHHIVTKNKVEFDLHR